jgi:alpha-glucoside transport system permease protein
MSSIAGKKSGLTWAVHISVVLLVALWLFPTVGLFISSFRTADQIATSGWWNALFTQEQNLVLRTAAPSEQRREGDLYVVQGNLFGDNAGGTISALGVSSRAISEY